VTFSITSDTSHAPRRRLWKNTLPLTMSTEVAEVGVHFDDL
jgi:hypothetical protein